MSGPDSRLFHDLSSYFFFCARRKILLLNIQSATVVFNLFGIVEIWPTLFSSRIKKFLTATDFLLRLDMECTAVAHHNLCSVNGMEKLVEQQNLKWKYHVSAVFIIANKSSVIRCKKNRKTRRNKRRGRKPKKKKENEKKLQSTKIKCYVLFIQIQMTILMQKDFIQIVSAIVTTKIQWSCISFQHFDIVVYNVVVSWNHIFHHRLPFCQFVLSTTVAVFGSSNFLFRILHLGISASRYSVCVTHCSLQFGGASCHFLSSWTSNEINEKNNKKNRKNCSVRVYLRFLYKQSGAKTSTVLLCFCACGFCCCESL